MMLRKKYVLYVSVTFICTFISVIIYSTYLINKYDKREVRPEKVIAKKEIYNGISLEINKLGKEYTMKKDVSDTISKNFIKNSMIRSNVMKNEDFKKIWQEAKQHITKEQLYDSENSYLANVLQALKYAPIVHADVDSRGTQLKLLLELEGGQIAVFKPQWYNKSDIITGTVYAGNDRYGAEILAFYLSGILNVKLTPITAERIISIRNDILPVATVVLNSTIFEVNNKTCVFGKCFYCKKEKSVCENTQGKLHGAAIIHIPGKLTTHRSPWQRTYKSKQQAPWETEHHYCDKVKPLLARSRLLDLIDAAIFDFLIQNGDRHHYETFQSKVLLLDNGKGLGNPYVHHLDILAPLYQCCSIRSTTFERLKKLSGGVLKESLASISEVSRVVAVEHLESIEKRLLFIFATIENCKKDNKMFFY